MRRIMFALWAISLMGCYSKAAPEKTGLEGSPMPAFSLLLSDSVSYFNTKDVPNDRPTVLFFFNPHCPYCKAQIEEIIKEERLLKNIRFYIFTTWPFIEMKQFYDHYELQKYPNIEVGVDNSNFFVDYFKAQGVPYMAIYGSDKKLHQAFMGKISAKQIEDVAKR